MSAAAYVWVEKEITRKGKTHKQWFRKKDPAAAAVRRASIKKGAAPEPSERAKQLQAFAPPEKPKAVSAPEPKPVEPKKAAPAPEMEKPKPTEMAPPKPPEKPPGEPTPAKSTPTDPKVLREEVRKMIADLPRVKPEKVNPPGLDEKAVQARMSESNAAYGKLSAPEKEAVKEYVQGDYYAMRLLQQGHSVEKVVEALKGASPLGPPLTIKEAQRLKALGPHLVAAQQKMGVKNPTPPPLYRGMSVDDRMLHSLLSKDSFVQKDPTSSTTFDPTMAYGFAKGSQKHKVIIKYRNVGQATSMMHKGNPKFAKTEQEMLVGSGKYKVVSRSFVQGKGYMIEVEQEA